MPSREPITREFLLSILDYDPETGIWRWRWRQDEPKPWNMRWAGNIAGCRRSDGYCILKINGATEYSHRLAWRYMTGDWPPTEIDHRDLDPSNNRWENLRLGTHSQNGCNVKRKRHNTSGVKGVYFQADRQLWSTEVAANGTRTFVGRFKEIRDAEKAVRAKREQLHGEFVRHE